MASALAPDRQLALQPGRGLPPLRGAPRASLAFSLGVVLGLALVLYPPGFANPVNLFDEGLFLAGAERIREGEALYRDVFSMYGPWPYQLLAVAFDLLGASVLSLRTLTALYDSVLAVGALLLVRRFAPWYLALAVTATVVVDRATSWGLMLPVWAFVAAALAPPNRLGRAAGCCVAGALAGLGAGVKPEVAAYAAAGLVVMSTLAGWRHVALLGVGLATGVAPLVALLVSSGSLEAFWHDVVIVGARQINAVALPWPNLTAAMEPNLPAELRLGRAAAFFEFASPFLLLPIAGWCALAGWWPATAERRHLVTGLAVFGALLLGSQLVRADTTHILYAQLPARLLAAGLLAATVAPRVAWKDRPGRLRLARWLAVAGTVVAVVSLAPTVTRSLQAAPAMLAAGVQASSLPRVASHRLPVYEGPSNALFFTAIPADVARVAPPGSRVLVLPGWAPAFQFAMERAAPDRYDWILEGVLTAEEAAALTARLAARPPAAVVAITPDGLASTAFRSQLAILGQEPLLDLVLARFRVVREGLDYVVLVPR